MQNSEMEKLLPKNKFDIESINYLKQFSFEELEPIVPKLLEWIQDYNWPVAKHVVELLKPFSKNISNELIKILKSNDEIWKYWCLYAFGIWNEVELSNDIIIEIKRIAINPTESEIKEHIQETAIEILKKLNAKY